MVKIKTKYRNETKWSHMPVTEFLEQAPLYRKIHIKYPDRWNEIPKPSVHMHCEKCRSDQTFQMINKYNWEGYEHGECPLEFEAMCLYKCAACGNERTFLLHFEATWDQISYQELVVTKAGQYPPWTISIDKDLARVLEEYEDTYKKGLICESQGYGIGAYAYYRRIIEDIIDKLLDLIPDLMSENDKKIYMKELEKTKSAVNASDKIDLVKDLLPPSLRPGGKNPLSILHQTLSEGLHAKNDDECLEIAENIRLVLTYLVGQIMVANESSNQFTEGMKKLLEKKSNRTKSGNPY